MAPLYRLLVMQYNGEFSIYSEITDLTPFWAHIKRLMIIPEEYTCYTCASKRLLKFYKLWQLVDDHWQLVEKGSRIDVNAFHPEVTPAYLDGELTAKHQHFNPQRKWPKWEPPDLLSHVRKDKWDRKRLPGDYQIGGVGTP